MEESLVVIVRACIAFFTMLIYARLIGKQQIGNLTMFDYINGITIGSIAGTLATDLSTKAFIHWLALTTFIILTVVLQFTNIKSRYLSKVINSEPVTLMQQGKILEDNLHKTRITKDELMVQLRSKNIFDPTEVEVALLEPDGSLSVLPKTEFQAVNKRDMDIPIQRAKITTEVIVDGVLIKENLRQRLKNQAWLEQQLQRKGISNWKKEVSYAAILPNETLYVDKYEDDIGKRNNISDYPEGPF
jgi:uncharacterized membrane protein YcaP (DUF421 family)